MRDRILAAGLFALLCAATAQASGVGLRWNACYGEGTGEFVRAFACNTNAGGERVVGSFSSPVDVAQIAGLEITVDVSTCLFVVGDPCPSELPEWWKFHEAGACRMGSLGVTFGNDPGNVHCQTWGPGGPTGGITAYQFGFPNTSSARLVLDVASDPATPGAVLAEHEYTAFTLEIDHQATVGPGACGGCQQSVGLVFGELRILPPIAANEVVLWAPIDTFNSNLVYWQTQPVATRRGTWGALKALYR